MQRLPPLKKRFLLLTLLTTVSSIIAISGFNQQKPSSPSITPKTTPITKTPDFPITLHDNKKGGITATKSSLPSQRVKKNAGSWRLSLMDMVVVSMTGIAGGFLVWYIACELFFANKKPHEDWSKYQRQRQKDIKKDHEKTFEEALHTITSYEKSLRKAINSWRDKDKYDENENPTKGKIKLINPQDFHQQINTKISFWIVKNQFSVTIDINKNINELNELGYYRSERETIQKLNTIITEINDQQRHVIQDNPEGAYKWTPGSVETKSTETFWQENKTLPSKIESLGKIISTGKNMKCTYKEVKKEKEIHIYAYTRLLT
ncbi:MAG: hypothetical protein ACPGC9_02520, partial [Cytophagales bacterium]